MNKEILLFALVILVISCKQFPVNKTSSFLYLAHTRVKTNDSVYHKVYDIDFTEYDMLLLGGDMAVNSFAQQKITAHLDSIFDFKKPTTLWSVGNHDKTSDENFYTTTLKQKYHVYQKDDVTFITLDSQDSLSSIVGKQKDFLFSVLDTIQTSSVLLMTHKLIFMNDHPILDSKIAKICNANKGTCFHCHNPNNFQKEIYPKLLELKDKGKQIIWVGGDLGYKTSEFEYIDPQGIVFLGNGFWYPKDWNKVLLFSKTKNNPLHYKFVHIDSIFK